MGKSIKTTITVAIGILAVAVISLSVSAVYYIRQSNNALYEMNEINSVKQRYAINFRGSAHDRAIYIRDFVLMAEKGQNTSDVESKIRQLKEFYDDSEQKLDAMFADKNIPVDENDRKYLADIKSIKLQAENYIDDIISHSKRGLAENARDILMRNARNTLFSWVDSINVFIDWEEEKNIVIRERITNLARVFNVVIVVLALVTVGLLVLIAAWLMKTITPLSKVARALENIAEGDANLTSKLPVTSDNEIGQVAKGFNQFVERLHSIILTVRNATDNLANSGNRLPESVDTTKGAISEINADINGINQQVESQSRGVTEVSANINKINENISKLNEMIGKQSDSVDNSSYAVEELVANVQSVTSTVSKSMAQFDNLTKVSETGYQKVDEVQKQVNEIAEKSKVMSEANRVINEIAGQTNLLAMNAAIEAAHAGEAGKGFAVVADEIRKLAENSATQSKAISSTLKDLINSIDTVVNSSQEASVAFESVRSAVGVVQNLQHQISSAMDEQSAGNMQVGQSFRTIKDLNDSVRKGSMEMMDASGNIQNMMQNLVKATNDIIESVSHMSTTTEDIQKVIASLEEVGSSTTENIMSVEHEIKRFVL